MAAGVQWIHLLDPTEDEVRASAPVELHETAVSQLTAPGTAAVDARPSITAQGPYVLAVLVDPIARTEQNKIVYRELDLVVTADAIVTVCKTSAAGDAVAEHELRDTIAEGDSAGMATYRIVDEIAEDFLDLIDDVDSEIEELEDSVDRLPAEAVRDRISALRHDMLHIRRILAPFRDAVREVVDNRVDVEQGTLFDRATEIAFANAYDKLLRASEGLDFTRDLLGSVRDYHMAKVATDQNEVMKRLTVIASVLLLPTFIVGLYGQNFKHIPELDWYLGYLWSWGLIVATTIIQLAFYRWRRWI